MFTTHTTGHSTHRPRACARFLLQNDAQGPSVDGSGHLATCAACRDEVGRQQVALAALRGAAEVEAGDTSMLSPARRRVVLAEAGSRPGFGWGLLPLLDWRPAGAMAAAAAVTVAIGLSAWLLETPGARDMHNPQVQVASAAIGADLQVVAEGSAVRLSWNSDGQKEHRVIRATDPRELESGRVATVRGNQWVDPESNGARVVFYVVD